MGSDDSMLVTVVTSLAFIGLCSLPATFSLVLHSRRQDGDRNAYEDADGKATPETVKAFSTKLPKICILIFAFSGLAVSLATALLFTHSDGYQLQHWLSTSSWGALLFQAFIITWSRGSVEAYNLGLYSLLSSLALAGVLIIQGTKSAESLLQNNRTLFALRAIELGLSICLSFASVSLPRRPDVLHQGEPVDRMYTTTALGRYTFSWPTALLTLASTKKNLDMTDLPRPDHYTRAASTSEAWKKRNSKRPLWLSLFLAHKTAIAIQWFLTLCTSVLNFAPQYVILQLLRLLEKRQPGTSSGIDAWAWVFWLGISIVVGSWLESWLFWMSSAELAIPVRAQLGALVFEKSIRKKDIKGVSKSKEGPTEPSEGSESDGHKPTKGDDAEELKQSKQSTVNLIGVDARRVGDFASFQYMFPGSLFKLVVSVGFLISLLGWKALFSGLSAMLAIMPVNIYFSKKYAAAQDRLMKTRDKKMEVVTEALQGIRQIKFSALEPDWENKIGAVRERELGAVWDVFVTDTMLLACWITSPILLAAISLAVYAYINGSLTPSVAFVSLGVFKALEVTLSIIPELTTDVLDAWISVKRLEEYLNSAEVSRVSKDGEEVSFDGASIAWPAGEETNEEDRFVLRDINVTFPKGELSVISGKTGTGKSLMLAAILGEVDVLGGTFYVPRPPPLAARHDDKANKGNWIIPEAIAYVAQIPWIENASIKDNILFGLPFDEDRYKKTVEVCALKKDLEMLSDGENTEIGANGINLSGGQKWRITLARAIYSRAGILVLDDIFSAVDAHVGRHIFENCLNGELATGRTRILVTHHVALCEPKTKYLVELGDGGVLNAGALSELREEGALQKIKSHEQSSEEIEADESVTAVNSDGSTDDDGNEAAGNTLQKVLSKTAARKFVEEESREKGAVKTRVYSAYLNASGGWIYWTVAALVFSLTQGFTLGRSWWLKIWTGTYDEEHANVQHLENNSLGHSFYYAEGVRQTSLHAASGPSMSIHVERGLTFYLGVYVGLAIIGCIISTAKFFYIFLGSLKASRKLFAEMNFTILRTPIRWLDTVPVGRILNRYTNDFSVIDSQLANSFSFGFNSVLSLLTVIIAGLVVSPYILILALVLLLICLRIAITYMDAARPVKRLESTTKSPVFEQFGSSLTGVATIRGFDKAEVYIERMYKKIDDYSTATWHLWLFNRWMGWRMAIVGSVFSSFVASLILLTPGIDAALAGFALAFALDFSSSVIWAIRLYSNLELNMNAAERIVEYTELTTESLDGISPPAAWPTGGRIEVDNLVVSYADDLPPVLKGLNFSVNSNERVGVVGRTGAGKSSLTLALFRFLEARSGSIHIDGIDISKIKLHDLRSRLAIIPQDPVLFSGTVRSNLDPFDHHTDAELRDCLERVHLISDSENSSGSATPEPESSEAAAVPKNTNIFKKLDSPISEGGLNLSQGQRQLLCLARAIVSRPRIMVLDEATSAVDMHTDGLIQRSIREEFTDATLLVIAHRLSTIADFDRVLVLSDGCVAEFGSPKELWEKGKGGIFRGMCEESGEKEKLKAVIFGEGQ
ncbi:P-loop containing nucleoside triphosphate hydrolase protein [Triangularia verruculosa]|uniref:P-loop containing nucleoside triphosphate hydrolase protein n=1 Tax=Triangularia verruculosa TaxID=2587418 RepID=A0AAN6XAY0_9PEZI|nr:P-loop containing nucleoside triphosphate hydrolase protein [Triangularia verruculosa]